MVKCMNRWSASEVDFEAANTSVPFAKQIEQIHIVVEEWEQLPDARVQSLPMHILGEVARIPQLEFAFLHLIAARRNEMLKSSTPRNAGLTTASVGFGLQDRASGRARVD